MPPLIARTTPALIDRDIPKSSQLMISTRASGRKPSDSTTLPASRSTRTAGTLAARHVARRSGVPRQTRHPRDSRRYRYR